MATTLLTTKDGHSFEITHPSDVDVILYNPFARRTRESIISYCTQFNFEHKEIPKAAGNISNSAEQALHAKQIGGDHYKTLGVEPWKAIKAWLSLEEWMGFLRGNIIKYQARANSGKGSRIENLEKAGHYQEALAIAIEEYKAKEKSNEEVVKHTDMINSLKS